MKYVFEITEELRRTVIVEAEDYEDAEEKVYNSYDDDDIILSTENSYLYDHTINFMAEIDDEDEYEDFNEFETPVYLE